MSSSILKNPITSDDHIQGASNAPITLLEYGDYECPACGSAYPIIKQIQKHFDTKLRFVFRHFPLTEIHPHAEIAAETAEFAGAHGKFWEMHDLIYQNQPKLTLPLLFTLTKALKLSDNKLDDMLQSGAFKTKIKNDFLSGINSGVTATPSFFINGKHYNGPYTFDNLVKAIEQQLLITHDQSNA